jgi:hypothetical protein
VNVLIKETEAVQTIPSAQEAAAKRGEASRAGRMRDNPDLEAAEINGPQ